MRPRIRKSDLQRWIAGQRKAERVIREERAKDLRNLSTEESLEMYLALTNTRFGNPPPPNEPSYVLMAMRRALEKCSERQKRVR